MLCKKIAALENTEDAMIFSSGMAAISCSLMLAFLKKRRSRCHSTSNLWRNL